jgi:nucleoside-diphosphate kinase
MEKTFLMVKPDGVQRNLIGEIVSRFEQKGFQLVGGKLMSISKELAEEHYGEHKDPARYLR